MTQHSYGLLSDDGTTIVNTVILDDTVEGWTNRDGSGFRPWTHEEFIARGAVGPLDAFLGLGVGSVTADGGKTWTSSTPDDVPGPIDTAQPVVATPVKAGAAAPVPGAPQVVAAPAYTLPAAMGAPNLAPENPLEATP